jgi:hypothetical protein
MTLMMNACNYKVLHLQNTRPQFCNKLLYLYGTVHVFKTIDVHKYIKDGRQGKARQGKEKVFHIIEQLPALSFMSCYRFWTMYLSILDYTL